MDALVANLIAAAEAEALTLGVRLDAADKIVKRAEENRRVISDRLYFVNRLIEAAQNLLSGERHEVPL